jgi:hypothetical protein
MKGVVVGVRPEGTDGEESEISIQYFISTTGHRSSPRLPFMWPTGHRVLPTIMSQPPAGST